MPLSIYNKETSHSIEKKNNYMSVFIRRHIVLVFAALFFWSLQFFEDPQFI